MSRRAFTLVELLVVAAISAVLSAMAITYSNVARNYITLSIETSKISQFILQAKQLSLATYNTGGFGKSCGYGVLFNLNTTPQTYSIFAYNPNGFSSCPNASQITNIKKSGGNAEVAQYTQGTWQVPVARGVVLQSRSHADGLSIVLFYPPNPSVFLSSNFSDGNPSVAQNSPPLKVYLSTVDGANSGVISVNAGGQVSF